MGWSCKRKWKSKKEGKCQQSRKEGPDLRDACFQKGEGERGISLSCLLSGSSLAANDQDEVMESSGGRMGCAISDYWEGWVGRNCHFKNKQAHLANIKLVRQGECF